MTKQRSKYRRSNKTASNNRHEILVCLFLILATVAVYWSVKDHEFINFDDDLYVENSNVRDGLTLRNFSWAFSLKENDTCYWHPLTWISHMVDCELYGLNSGMHHRMNLLFHITNTLLLFIVLKQITGMLWRSAFVALLFGLHPINVESVAWVAERKNVLSTLFWLLTMLAYVYYTKKPGVFKYLLLLSAYTLGLLAKPMLVTLPFVLLLLDFWPLRRMRAGQISIENPSTDNIPPAGKTPYWRFVWLVVEKIPLILLSAVSIYMSISSFRHMNILMSREAVPMPLRVENALVSYVLYIFKMLWPKDLAIFYPFPTAVPLWQVVGSVLLLSCITGLAIGLFKKRPYLCIGWFWYLGTILPVIGLMQGGLWPAMADRFAYVPFIGLFIAIVWGLHDLTHNWRYQSIVFILAGTIIAGLMGITRLQVSYWRNDLLIFSHALDVTRNNYMAHNNLGIALKEQGKTKEAISHFSSALIIAPDLADAHYNLGVTLFSQGMLEKAREHFEATIRITPGYADAYNNLGVIYLQQGKLDAAITHFTEAIKLEPDNGDVHFNIGLALYHKGKTEEAIAHFREAVQQMPDDIIAHRTLEEALSKKQAGTN